jgi:hypothetical protein
LGEMNFSDLLDIVSNLSWFALDFLTFKMKSSRSWEPPKSPYILNKIVNSSMTEIPLCAFHIYHLAYSSTSPQYPV